MKKTSRLSCQADELVSGRRMNNEWANRTQSRTAHRMNELTDGIAFHLNFSAIFMEFI